MLTARRGYDTGYLTGAAGSSAGSDYYLSSSGSGQEPPGIWAGSGADLLGLTGEVDADTMRNLYHGGIAPDGSRVGKARYTDDEAAKLLEEQISAACEAEGPYITAERRCEIANEIKGKAKSNVAFIDMTYSVPKSISVAQAGYLAAARSARDRGDLASEAWNLTRHDQLETAIRETAAEMLTELERTALYTRTGHAGYQVRDATGMVAAMFYQRTNRDNAPHTHIHMAILNKALRADEADTEHRALDAREIFGPDRLRLGTYADRTLQAKLTALGFAQVIRPDGSADLAGVDEPTCDAFSSRRQAVLKAAAPLVKAYVQKWGHEPSRRALKAINQHATLITRKAKSHETVSPARQLADWEAISAKAETAELATVAAAVDTASLGASVQVEAVTGSEIYRAASEAIRAAQSERAAWTRGELFTELGRRLPLGVTREEVAALTDKILDGAVPGLPRLLTIAPAAQVADLRAFGTRRDGTPVVQAPGKTRYATEAQVDAETMILAEAERVIEAAATVDSADAALADSGLSDAQRAVVTGLLSSDRALDVLIAPPGAGKTFSMAALAEAHRQITGRNVIGLTTSTNAARVLTGEGLQSHNLAHFLGKLEGTDNTRGHLPVYAGDILVIDESSQVSTYDMAQVIAIARRTGARVILTGDPEQLSSPEAGGILRLVSSDHGHYSLREVRRFRNEWETAASLRLHDGDQTVIAEYIGHGRVREGAEADMHSAAVTHWLADHLAGKDSVLLATSDTEVSELAREARERLISLGKVERNHLAQIQGDNFASRGDRIRARKNLNKITLDGKSIANRDELTLVGMKINGRAVVRRPNGSQTVVLPKHYLEDSTELSYSANTATVQGRTTDFGHMIVSDTTDSGSLLVGTTRGRHGNFLYAVTSRRDSAETGTARPAPELKKRETETVTTAQAVLIGAMRKEPANLSALEVMRAAQDEATNMAHLHALWLEGSREGTFAEFDLIAQASLSPEDYTRYKADPELTMVNRKLRAAQLSGRDAKAILAEAITRKDMKGAKSIAGVIAGRIGDLAQFQTVTPDSYVSATPEISDPAMAEALDSIARAMDSRTEELGRQAADDLPVWAVRHLGMPPELDTLERAGWELSAGRAASYREITGYTDAASALPPMPEAGAIELRSAYSSAAEAIGLTPAEIEMASKSDAELFADSASYDSELEWEPEAVDMAAALMAEQDAVSAAEIARASGDLAALEAAQIAAQDATAHAQRAREMDSARNAWHQETEPQRQAAIAADRELKKRGGEGWQANRDRIAEHAAERDAASTLTDPLDRAREAARIAQDRAQARSEATADSDADRDQADVWRDLADADRDAPWQPGRRSASTARDQARQADRTSALYGATSEAEIDEDY